MNLCLRKMLRRVRWRLVLGGGGGGWIGGISGNGEASGTKAESLGASRSLYMDKGKCQGDRSLTLNTHVVRMTIIRDAALCPSSTWSLSAACPHQCPHLSMEMTQLSHGWKESGCKLN